MNRKCIICYQTSGIYGERSQYIWTSDYNSLADFEKECPLAKVHHVFYETDDLLVKNQEKELMNIRNICITALEAKGYEVHKYSPDSISVPVGDVNNQDNNYVHINLSINE